MIKNIPVSSPLIDEYDIESVKRCLESGWISSMGPDVIEFEKKFAKFHGAHYGVATNSGTTALHLSLASLGLKRGDKIIMPTFTMIATINAAEYLGLEVILVDANIKTWTMNLEDLFSNLNKNIKAIMPVHIYGHPEDMISLTKETKDLDIKIIEDAAEAHGAEINGRKVGTFGNVSAFSFYANKIITTGEGGICVTNNEELAERMAWLRAHAFGRGGKHFWHEELGYGYRMSALQAALGLSQMDKLTRLVDKRRENAHLYNKLLKPLADEQLITLPVEENWAKNVYWMYSILIHNGKRDDLMSYLSKSGIETRTFFYPVHKQPYYHKRYKNNRFPVADKISAEGINLPSGNLLSPQDVEFVSQKIIDFFHVI